MSDESGGFFGSDSADVGLEDHLNSGIQGNDMSEIVKEGREKWADAKIMSVNGFVEWDDWASKNAKALLDQIEQKDKQLDRQEAAMFRMKEEISKHLMTINNLRQKLGRGL